MRASLNPHERQRSRHSVPAGFHPIRSMEWYSAYWAEGDEFAALGYTDGASVTAFPDEIGAADLTVGTAPTFQASIAAFSKPGVRFAAGQYLRASVNHADLRGYVTVRSLDNVSTNRFIDNDGDGSGRVIPGDYFGGAYQLYAGGTAQQSFTYVNAKHLFAAYIATGSGDWLQVDNQSIYAGASVGDNLANRLNLGNNGSHSGCSFVFGGFTTVDPTTQTNWADFVAWVGAYYGITMS